MNVQILQGILIPFFGTMIGASFVFVMKKEINELVERALLGFAAGVMVAASIWSLLIPAMDHASDLGIWTFVPAVAGFWIGILFLLFLDKTIPHIHLMSQQTEGRRNSFQKTTMLFLAVMLHNLPEGMAVGIVYAGWMAQSQNITSMSALALALGIAIQNIPEGAVLSMPLHYEGISKTKSFLYGTLSGIVEPIGTILTLYLAKYLLSFLPYLLSFAAGAMIYVVIEELIPEMSQGRHSNAGTLFFASGFTLMMILDIVLG